MLIKSVLIMSRFSFDSRKLTINCLDETHFATFCRIISNFKRSFIVGRACKSNKSMDLIRLAKFKVNSNSGASEKLLVFF